MKITECELQLSFTITKNHFKRNISRSVYGESWTGTLWIRIFVPQTKVSKMWLLIWRCLSPGCVGYFWSNFLFFSMLVGSFHEQSIFLYQRITAQVARLQSFTVVVGKGHLQTILQLCALYIALQWLVGVWATKQQLANYCAPLSKAEETAVSRVYEAFSSDKAKRFGLHMLTSQLKVFSTELNGWYTWFRRRCVFNKSRLHSAWTLRTWQISFGRLND